MMNTYFMDIPADQSYDSYVHSKNPLGVILGNFLSFQTSIELPPWQRRSPLCHLPPTAAVFRVVVEAFLPAEQLIS